MFHTQRNTLLSLITLGVLLFQMLNPLPARAEGEATPMPDVTEAITELVIPPTLADLPSETATDTPSAALPSETATEAATETLAAETATPAPAELLTETPAPAETLPPTLPAALTETPAPAVQPEEQSDEPKATEIPLGIVAVTPAETTAPETPAPTETEAGPVDLPALLEQAPAGTDMIILGADGQPEPLASVAAAEALATSDPVWCPTGQAPTPGANGCTGNYTTMNELLAAIVIGAGGPPYETISPAQNGTIWITSGAVGDVSAIIIDGLTYASWANYALTLQGGWSGTSGDTTIGANSVFTVPIQIDGWHNNVTLNHITVDSGTGSRINFIDGDVNINNSQFMNATIGGEDTGLYVVTRNGGDVFIDNSQFDNNSAGLDVSSSGNISITASIFSNNTVYGLMFSNNTNAYVEDSSIIDNNIGIWYQGDSGATPSALDLNLTLDCVTLAGNSNNFSGDDLSVGPITISPTEILCTSSPTPATPTPATPTPATPTPATPTPATPTPATPTPATPTPATPTPATPTPATPTPATSTPATPTPVVMSHTTIYRLAPGQKEITFDLACKTPDQRYWVIAPSGDLLEIHCMVSGKAKITLRDNTELPGDLPAGYEYASAYGVNILQGETSIPVITTGGYIRGYFVAEQSNATYGILFWNAERQEWEPLKDFQMDASGMPVVFPFDPANPDDLRKILSGARYLDQLDPDRMDVSMNFTGLFVLVK